MGLCVFSLPISLVMIGIIYILCLIIIIKWEVWTIAHCLGLGHETGSSLLYCAKDWEMYDQHLVYFFVRVIQCLLQLNLQRCFSNDPSLPNHFTASFDDGNALPCWRAVIHNIEIMDVVDQLYPTRMLPNYCVFYDGTSVSPTLSDTDLLAPGAPFTNMV